MTTEQLEHLVSQLILGYAHVIATIEALLNFTMSRLTEEEKAELETELKKAQANMVKLMKEYTSGGPFPTTSGTFTRGNPSSME